MNQKKLKVSLILILLFISFLIPVCSYANNIEVNTYSPCIILMEPNTGKVIYEKDANKRMYPASTTKIMTAILALEHYEDLSQTATVSYNAIFSIPSRICKCQFTIRRRINN